MSHGGGMVIEKLLKQIKSKLIIAESNVDKCDTKQTTIWGLCRALGSVVLLLFPNPGCFRCPPCDLLHVSHHPQRKLETHQFVRLLKISNGLIVHFFLNLSISAPRVSSWEGRVDFDRLFSSLYRHVVPVSEQVLLGSIRMYSGGERVKFLRASSRLNGFVVPSYMPQEQTIPAVAPRIARVQLYRTLEPSLRFFPLPLVFLASRCECGVRLRD